MNASRKYAVMILAVMFTLCTVCAYGSSEGRGSYGRGGYSRHASNSLYVVNAWLKMDENPPCLERVIDTTNKRRKINFEVSGDCWAIREIPKGTTFTVPDGYKIRCVILHARAKGGLGKPSENKSMTYPAGTTVMYTRSSFLYVFKN